MSGVDHLDARGLRAAILARLEAKSDHDYRWPRWAAAEEAAAAVIELLSGVFDPEEFECGRLGLPCTSVAPSDRWCRPCRLRTALHGDSAREEA